jgi:hypothetical protein
MRLFLSFRDNAMLYKDITQWLRNKTFFMLFLGVLLLSESLSVLLSITPMAEGVAGVTIFASLLALLSLYALAIAFLGYGTTVREIESKTFELYELSGLSLEKMVLGKWFSMICQFYFGFFCIVPFIMFSFVLGGVDFYNLVTSMIIVSLYYAPFFLLVILLSLLVYKRKVAGVLRGLFHLVLFIPSLYFTLILFFTTQTRQSGGPIASLSTTLNHLLQLQWSTVLHVFFFFFFYGLLCCLLFFYCCQTICPRIDSRATVCQFLTFLFTGSYLAYYTAVIYVTPGPSNYFGSMYMPVFLLLMLTGFVHFYSDTQIPCMAKKRRASARRLSWFYFMFEPTAHGYFRTLSLMYILLLLFTAALYFLHTDSLSFIPTDINATRFISNSSLALQVPYFLAIPASFLLHVPFFKNNTRRIRTSIFWWWFGLGVTLCFFISANTYNAGYQSSLPHIVFLFLSVMISPLSSFFADIDCTIPADIATLRIALGIFGIIMMYTIIKRRTAAEAIKVTGHEESE